jgi:hypothetical protein
VNVPELISGLASSIIWSFFFMMCPQVFKVRSRESLLMPLTLTIILTIKFCI